MRKESNERKEGNNIFGRFYLSAIDIYRVTQGLEGVERNADRQNEGNNPTRPPLKGGEELAEFVYEEIVVFECKKDAEVENDIGYHPCLGFMVVHRLTG